MSLRTEVNTNFPNVPLVVTIEQTTDLVNCIVTAAAAPAQYNTCRRSVQLDDLSWKLLRVLATRVGEQYEWYCWERLIGEVVQSRRRPLLGPSPG